jgi:hypothetical protein
LSDNYSSSEDFQQLFKLAENLPEGATIKIKGSIKSEASYDTLKIYDLDAPVPDALLISASGEGPLRNWESLLMK